MKEMKVDKTCRCGHLESEHKVRRLVVGDGVCYVGVLFEDTRPVCNCWDGEYDEFGDAVAEMREVKNDRMD